MSGLKLRRLGLVMEPEPGNPQEAEGVLNPRRRGGNYPRLGIARVQFNTDDPVGMEWLGIALEPVAIMSGGPMAVVAARILASRSWYRARTI